MTSYEYRLNEKVVFCLARGYPTIRFYKYGKLILRNIMVRRALGNNSRDWDYLVFHEGNFTNFQKKLITVLSFCKKIIYVNVEDQFVVPSEFSEHSLKSNVGYVLMCRFNYLHVWSHLVHYKIAMRVDDDVFLTRFDPQIQDRIFDYALKSPESHPETNLTLPPFFENLGITKSYNQEFPYTNFYITRTDFWQRVEVRSVLENLGREKTGFENRWGDLPIIGTILNEFAKPKDLSLRSDITYFHSSHRTFVYRGLNVSINQFIKSKFMDKCSQILSR